MAEKRKVGYGKGVIDLSQFIPGSIKNADGINTVVSRLREEWIGSALGYAPPLYLDRKPSNTVASALLQGTIAVDQLPAAIMVDDLANNDGKYPGGLDNFKIEQTIFDPHNLNDGSYKKSDKKFRAAFEVSADLRNRKGTTEGTMRRIYSLYTVHRTMTDIPARSIWKNIYADEQTKTRRIAVLASRRVHGNEWMKIISDGIEREEASKKRGTRVARAQEKSQQQFGLQ